MSQNPVPELSNRDLKRARRGHREAKKLSIGCLLLVVLIVFVWLGFSAFYSGLSRLLSPGNPASIILADPAAEVIYLAVTLAILTALIGSAFSSRRKTPLTSAAILLAAMVIGPLLVYFLSYSRFWAVTPGRGKVELHYLWPRLNQTLSATEVSTIDVESESRHVKNSGSYYVSRLRITVDGKTWTSEWSRNQSLIHKTRDTILGEKAANRQ